MRFFAGTEAGQIEAYNIKLEPGSVATIWSPNVADTVGANNPITEANVGVYMASAAITTAYIKDAQITGAKIANATIATANIGDLQVTNAKIANLSVDQYKIADAAIVTAKIGDAQITNAKIASLSADKIDTGTLTSKTIYLNGGAIQSNNWVNGSTGWRIDGYGNADFNTVMVRTGNIQTNAVTKMAGGATSVLSFNGTTNGPTSIKYISCDGGDLFIQFSVRLQATGSWAGSSTIGIYTSSVLFSLYVNYSLVDSAKLTADVSAEIGRAHV